MDVKDQVCIEYGEGIDPFSTDHTYLLLSAEDLTVLDRLRSTFGFTEGED